MAVREVTNFKGLKAAKVVSSHPSLKDKIENEGFPPGFWAGPNTHLWFVDEVNDWLAARPQERPEEKSQILAKSVASPRRISRRNAA